LILYILFEMTERRTSCR